VSTTRGRGRPKSVDEQELVERIRTSDDLLRIRDALIANDEPPGQSSGCIFWLDAVRAGDPTGGCHRVSAFRYRTMLARLPEIPLPPASRRRRRADTRGFASTRLLSVASGAGLLALAAQPGPVALRALAAVVAPIMPEASDGDGAGEIRGPALTLVPFAPDGVRECGPVALSSARPARDGYTRSEFLDELEDVA
jgi:hypothetical protein